MSDPLPAEATPPACAPPPPLSRRWLWIIVAVWLVTGALYLTMPSSPDQFDHNYMGWRVLEGDIPYRDFIDPNWPGLIWLHALATAIFGNHLWSWHVLDFLLMAAGVIFLQDLLRRGVNPAAANVVLLLFPLVYVSLPHWFVGQHDVTPAHLLLITLWFHARAYAADDARWQGGAGFFLGAAALVKPTAALLGPLLVLQALFLRVPLRRLILHSGVTAVVSAATLVVGLAAAVAQGASAREVAESLWIYVLNAKPDYHPTRTAIAVQVLSLHFVWWPVLTAAAIPACLWALRSTHRSISTTAPIVLWLTGLMSYLIQGNDYVYHLGPCIHALVALAATSFGLASTVASTKDHALRWRRVAIAWSAVTFLSLSLKLATNYGALISSAMHGDWAYHLSRFKTIPGLTAVETVDLAARIRRDVPEDQTILTVGSASALNYLSHRRQATHLYYGPMLPTIGPPFPLSARWSEQWRQDLLLRKPQLCFIHEDVREPWLGSDDPLAVFLRDFLSREYQLVGTAGTGSALQIYERKGLSRWR